MTNFFLLLPLEVISSSDILEKIKVEKPSKKVLENYEIAYERNDNVKVQDTSQYSLGYS